jgi:hypothetical protein
MCVAIIKQYICLLDDDACLNEHRNFEVIRYKFVCSDAQQSGSKCPPHHCVGLEEHMRYYGICENCAISPRADSLIDPSKPEEWAEETVLVQDGDPNPLFRIDVRPNESTGISDGIIAMPPTVSPQDDPAGWHLSLDAERYRTDRVIFLPLDNNLIHEDGSEERNWGSIRFQGFRYDHMAMCNCDDCELARYEGRYVAANHER